MEGLRKTQKCTAAQNAHASTNANCQAFRTEDEADGCGILDQAQLLDAPTHTLTPKQ